MINSLNGRKNAIELMENKGKLSNSSIIILLLTALIVSQVITFFRLKEYHEVISDQNMAILTQDLNIQELINGQKSLFEIQRLQSELNILQDEFDQKDKRPSWNLQEI